ncbi:hypothetical protein Efla_006014 [Eimeria flavescens]
MRASATWTVASPGAASAPSSLLPYEDGKRVVAYAALALPEHEKKWTAPELEAAALIWALETFPVSMGPGAPLLACAPLCELAQARAHTPHIEARIVRAGDSHIHAPLSMASSSETSDEQELDISQFDDDEAAHRALEPAEREPGTPGRAPTGSARDTATASEDPTSRTAVAPLGGREVALYCCRASRWPRTSGLSAKIHQRSRDLRKTRRRQTLDSSGDFTGIV